VRALAPPQKLMLCRLKTPRGPHLADFGIYLSRRYSNVIVGSTPIAVNTLGMRMPKNPAKALSEFEGTLDS
jgi:hypothetical protein